jgi:hypothetical protein
VRFLFGVDLNLHQRFCDPMSIFSTRSRDERRQVRIRAVDGASSAHKFPSLRAAISRRAQDQDLLMSGSVSMHGVRATDLSREPARYRSMSARTKWQALSSGHAHQSGGPQHLGACQRHSRLAYLCRVRSAFNHHRAQALCWRCSCSTAQGDGLRVGLYPHRSVPWYVQVDTLTTKQGWGEVAYLARSRAAPFPRSCT